MSRKKSITSTTTSSSHNNRRRIVISADYDLCFVAYEECIDSDKWLENCKKIAQEFQEKGKRERPDDPRYKERNYCEEFVIKARENAHKFQKNVEKYIDKLKTGDHAKTELYSGSARQTEDLDQFNAKNNYTESSFCTLESLCEKKGWKFKNLLLLDTACALPPGTAMDDKECYYKFPPGYFQNLNEWTNEVKLKTIQGQLDEVAENHTNEEIDFVFFDDDYHDKIFRHLKKYIRVPKNIRLHLVKANAANGVDFQLHDNETISHSSGNRLQATEEKIEYSDNSQTIPKSSDKPLEGTQKKNAAPCPPLSPPPRLEKKICLSISLIAGFLFICYFICALTDYWDLINNLQNMQNNSVLQVLLTICVLISCTIMLYREKYEMKQDEENSQHFSFMLGIFVCSIACILTIYGYHLSVAVPACFMAGTIFLAFGYSLCSLKKPWFRGVGFIGLLMQTAGALALFNEAINGSKLDCLHFNINDTSTKIMLGVAILGVGVMIINTLLDAKHDKVITTPRIFRCCG